MHHVRDGAQREAKTQELVSSITRLAPLAVQAMKHIVRQAESGTVDAKMALALARACAASEDLEEGFRAQKEKRTPHFRGK